MKNERRNKSINIEKISLKDDFILLTNCRGILYFLKGEAEICDKNQTITAELGDIVIIDKVNECQINSLKKDCAFIKIDLIDSENIVEEFFEELKKSPIFTNAVTKIKLSNKKRKTIEQIIYLMLFESEEETVYEKKKLFNYLQIVFIEIINFDKDDRREKSESKLRSKFSVVVSYIEENYSKKIYLQDIANLLHYETSYFSKLFKKVLGVSFSDYVQNVRLKKAEKLLEETDYSVETLSAMVGYQDKKQLYKLFRERSNITPGEFRRSEK